MPKSTKYRIAWVAIYIALGLFGFLCNNEYWVSVMEGILYYTPNGHQAEFTKHTSDVIFLIESLFLIPLFLLVPRRYGSWIPVLIAVLMVLILLLYLPTSYNEHPELYY